MLFRCYVYWVAVVDDADMCHAADVQFDSTKCMVRAATLDKVVYVITYDKFQGINGHYNIIPTIHVAFRDHVHHQDFECNGLWLNLSRDTHGMQTKFFFLADLDFVRVFLMTYQGFTEATVVLEKMKARYPFFICDSLRSSFTFVRDTTLVRCIVRWYSLERRLFVVFLDTSVR